MATATAKPVEPVQRTVLLELTEREAMTLIYIAEHVGGSTLRSRRRDTANIKEALCAALDVARLHVHTIRDAIPLEGHLRFGDEA